MSTKNPSPEELERTRDARVTKQRLDKHESYVALLRLAEHIRHVNDYPDDPFLSQALQRGESERQNLFSKAGGRIAPRRRPTRPGRSSEICTVFLDECGSHQVMSTETFGAFVLAAIIVRQQEYPTLSRTWRRWKKATFGSGKVIFHEPDFREGLGPFAGTLEQRLEMRRALAKVIADLDYAAIACVVNRTEYKAWLAGFDAPDRSLPSHPYLMVLDFLAERLVMALDGQFNGARAQLVAESRGPKEDALLQLEFARLFIDGTSYVSAGWFRHQLEPGIIFRAKAANIGGLQLADLLARPCGEKVLNPASTPERWPEFRAKLCHGQETKHSILGLKILPWDARYQDLWKS